MAGEIFAGLGAFKTMFDMAKGLKDINDAAIRNTAVIALQDQILTAQAAQAALIQRVGDLEGQLTQFEQWGREKERYRLAELPPGVFVYTIKEEARGAEPTHSICAKCYEDRRKSVLNWGESSNGLTKLHCPSCGWQGKTGHYQRPTIHRGSRNPKSWLGS